LSHCFTRPYSFQTIVPRSSFSLLPRHSVLRKNFLANAACLVVATLRLQEWHLRNQRERTIISIAIFGSDLLVNRQRFVVLAHCFQIRRHRQSRGRREIVVRIFIRESL